MAASFEQGELKEAVSRSGKANYFAVLVEVECSLLPVSKGEERCQSRLSIEFGALLEAVSQSMKNTLFASLNEADRSLSPENQGEETY